MAYLFYTLLFGLVAGLIGVATTPSPFYAALALVMVAGAGCGVLVVCGGAFFSLMLLLIYLGGMLVVFGYCACLASEPFPESWGSGVVWGSVMCYVTGVWGAAFINREGWYEASWVLADEFFGFSTVRGDMSGVAGIYSSGGGLLVVGAGALLLTLFVVLELTRGLGRGTLRAV